MDFSITDNSKQIKEELEKRTIAALTAVGLHAVRRAKEHCTYDTGLLRNSITFALDGESAAIKQYKADKEKAGEKKVGEYDGQAPQEGGGERAVFIGTNVEYARYVELGTSRQKPKPFLHPAVTNYMGEYKKIVEKYLKGQSTTP